MLVATAAGSALRDDDAHARLCQVSGELVAFEDLRPDGDRKLGVVSARAVRATAAADAAATCA